MSPGKTANDFEGQVVIVTGSSSGIGEATAVIFAQHGAMVTLTGRDEDRLTVAMMKCQEAGCGRKDRYLIVAGDINDKEIRKQIIEKTVEKFGRLDVLVSNAGTAMDDDTISAETEEAYDLMMATNIKSRFFLIQEAVPHLEKTKGCVVNMSSVMGDRACPHRIVFGMSNAALNHLTKVASLILAPKGIRVNAVSPTLVRGTRMLRHGKHSEEKVKTYLDKLEAMTPLEGRSSTIEEVAEVALFLASKSASFVSGNIVNVDGALARTGIFVMPQK